MDWFAGFMFGIGLGSSVTGLVFDRLRRSHNDSSARLLDVYRDIAIDYMPDDELRWELVRERAAGLNVFSNSDAVRKYRDAERKKKEES